MSEFYETAAAILISMPPTFCSPCWPYGGARAGSLWLVRNKLGPSRDVAFSLIWICAFLLPVFDLGVFPQGDIVHDRYFYLPSLWRLAAPRAGLGPVLARA